MHMQYRINYGSMAGSAETTFDISKEEIDILLDAQGFTPIKHKTVIEHLPDLHSRIMDACQFQEDECIRCGFYDVPEYEDMSPEDFIVTEYIIID